jgi:hypothetical protein
MSLSADLQPAITLARINIFDEVKSSWYLSLSSFRKYHRINFDYLSLWDPPALLNISVYLGSLHLVGV